MYTPKIFEKNNTAELAAFINSYPFATLVTHTEEGLEANHIPFLLHQAEGKTLLQGHIAKANPLWKNLSDKSEVLVVFHGPNCYISPNYYPTKKEHGKAVPTWNYAAVHVKGVMSYIDEDSWKLAMVTKLTDKHEVEQLEPWSVTDAPEEFTEKMLAAVVGIEIEVASMLGKWKVSQNQPDQNKLGVVTGLSQESNSGSQEMAALVNEAGLNTDQTEST